MRDVRRLPIPLAALVAAALVAPAPAPAAVRFKPCSGNSAPGVFVASHRDGGRDRIMCARVPVPLDRTGAVPGTVRLNVERVRASRRARGAVFALAGGPG